MAASGNGVSEIKVILVVEDDADMNELLKLILEQNGYRCLTAFNGEEAIRLARDGKPGLILLDIMLPDQDGVDVCRRLARNEETRKIPVIMVTVRHELSAKLSSYIAGARRFITKPFQPENLLHEVAATFRQSGYSDASTSLFDPRD